MIQNKESDKTLLKDFASRSRSEDINDFVNVYVICRSIGGDLEKIITHTTEILTDKMAIDREIKALTAQKKVEREDDIADALSHAHDDERVLIFICGAAVHHGGREDTDDGGAGGYGLRYISDGKDIRCTDLKELP